MPDPATARRMWRLGEPIHAVTYFADEAKAALEAAGLRGFWRGYFAARAAPLGPVGAGPVEATFFNFAPSMVQRALPEVWQMATPDAVLEARSAGAVEAIRASIGSLADDPSIGEAARDLQEAVESASPSGRTLFAANAALPLGDEPLAALWQVLTSLREHRGDGHNAALTVEGIEGCAAHVLSSSDGGAPREVIQPARGWTDDDWEDAVDRLSQRGLLDSSGVATDAGRSLHRWVEDRTDQLALGPWAHLGAERTAKVAAVLGPMARAIVDAEVVRFPNAMSLPPPE